MKNINLDERDKKLLYLLDCNAREPLTRIAKYLHVSPEAVLYRIKKLEEKGIIKNYQIVVDLSKLGLFQCKFCLKFLQMTSDKLTERIKLLEKLSEIKWIASTQGVYDMIISIETQSLKDIEKSKKNILDIFTGHILEKDFALLLSSEIYPRRYLTNTKNNIEWRMETEGNFDSNDLEKEILKELSKNSRISAVELADKIKTTARVVAYMLKKLSKKKIILGYKIGLDHLKLGINFYKIFVHLAQTNKESFDKFINSCKNNKNITHILQVLSNWDLELEFESFNSNDVEDFLSDLKDRFPEIIRKIEFAKITKEHKLEYI